MFEWIPAYQRFLLDVTLIDIILVISLLILFQCGLFSMATAGFAAIGGYTSALLVTDADWPVPLGILAAVFVGATLAVSFGLPVLRLRGIYLALGSLALAQVIVIGIANVGFTNGVFGISGIPTEVTTGWLVAIVAVILLVMELIHRSHFGRAMKAIRLDEHTAAGLGINVFAYRMATFGIGGAMAAMAGALEAHRTAVISPDQYDFGLLVVLLTYMFVGGVEHWLGPVLATIGFRILNENLEFAGTDWENFYYGSILVVVMLLAPDGLTSRRFTQRLARIFRRRPDLAT
ncbi:branched-chain amino acid ABC transporter permease [Ilumatobacter nonamiensis]|uniref:branched-chain amino acid ABC transporter permease n=1 Tax=Ilumatobacter nonamiensis TaxID=467093 RepID=UPI00058CE501|nr:branched-chain amino acid ABC transporter permease [Ilumatobacter nonamiensis]